MRNCFGGKSGGGVLRPLLLPTIFFAVILAGFLLGLSGMSRSVEGEQLKSTEQAVRRAVVHCYAVEGHYPTSLEYLEEHYGLLIDKDRYVVHYEPVAANLMPEITIFPLSDLEPGASGGDAFDLVLIDGETDLPGVDYAGLLEEDAI